MKGGTETGRLGYVFIAFVITLAVFEIAANTWWWGW